MAPGDGCAEGGGRVSEWGGGWGREWRRGGGKDSVTLPSSYRAGMGAPVNHRRRMTHMNATPGACRLQGFARPPRTIDHHQHACSMPGRS